MDPQLLPVLSKVFENLCVARCRDDWRLRTSLAKEIEGQMLIVTKLSDVLAQSRAAISGPNLGPSSVVDLLMKALDWAETSGNFVTIDIYPLISLASEVLNLQSPRCTYECL